LTTLLGVLWLSLPGLARPRFVLLPLDDRPCNLLFVRQIGRIAQAEVIAPPKNLLGSFLQPGQPEELIDWLRHTVQPDDQLLICSDMLCYGGLVASRQASTPCQVALDRLQSLRQLQAAHVQVLATLPRLSLRTSDQQAPYERTLHDWAARPDNSQPPAVPEAILAEYLGVRQRNLKVLQALLEATQRGWIDRLVIGQDDSHRTGLHRAEQQQLLEQRRQGGITSRVWLMSGADELSMDLLAGRLAELTHIHPKIAPLYSQPGAEQRIPPLESLPLETTVLQHLQLCGALPSTAEDPSALGLFIQVPSDHPYRLPIRQESQTSSPSQESEMQARNALVESLRSWMDQGKPAALADLAYINRMDPQLAQAVIERLDLTRLEGFAAWNTPANALGTVVAQVVVREIARRQAPQWPIAAVKESARTHLAFLLARLIDDYGYQTMVRTELQPQARGLPLDPDPLLSPYIQLGAEVRRQLLVWAEQLYQEHFLGLPVDLPGGRGPARLGPMKLEAILPWPRLFEVEVRLDVSLEPL